MGLALMVFGVVAAPLAGEEVPARPVGSPGDWVTTADYPATALAAGQQGTTGFRLKISGSGAVYDCEITESSGVQALDDKTCALLKERAKFTPATGSDGTGRVSSFSSRVRWVLPLQRKLPLPVGKKEVTIAVDVDDQGAVESCTILSENGDKEAAARACAAYPIGAKRTQYLVAGKSVAYHVVLTHEMEVTRR